MCSYGIEYSISFNHVVIERTLEILAICEIYSAFAVFRIVLKLTFVAGPSVLYLCEIFIIKGPSQLLRSVVEDPSITVKRGIFPETFVGQGPVGIEHLSIPLHLLIPPLPLVITSIVEL